MKPRQTFAGVSMEAVSAVGELFGSEAVRQEFALPEDDLGVWEVTHRAEHGNVRVLLWPSIDRVDVSVGPHVCVVKGIEELEVIEGLEVVVRYGGNGVLSLAWSGQVVVATSEGRGRDSRQSLE